MKKKAKFTIFALGLVLLFAFYARPAEANLFKDLWNGLLAPFSEKGAPSPDSAQKPPAAKEQAEPVPLYKPAIDYENAVVAAVKKASPAVVSITISKNVPVIERCPYDPFGDLPPEFRRFFGDDASPFYVPCERGKTELKEVGGGSGFIVSEDGLILTNKHVVADEKASYTVFLNDGRKYDASVLARDPAQDLAIIRIPASGLPVVELGDSNTLALGQTAIAIGNALGEFRNTVSVGVISGLSRKVTAAGGGGFSETIYGVIQTDAAINPGNSGGPLLNLRGQVVGINTAVASGAENIGFAIPINDAKRDIESVKATGEIQLPFLGVRYVIITPKIAESRKLPADYGALLESDSGPAVSPDSPAAAAGLKAGDIILELGGQKVDEENPLASIIAKHKVGETVDLKVLRGGEALNLKATLAKRPAKI
jgi:S1-C subfamily serine protease